MRARKTIRGFLLIGLACAIFAPLLALSAVVDQGLLAQQPARFSTMAAGGAPLREEMVSRLMVKPRPQAGDQLNSELHARDASRLALLSNTNMSVLRPMSGGAHVISLLHPVTLSEARVIANRLMQDNSVEVAEPDRKKRHFALTPTDPDYAPNPQGSNPSGQWNLFVPASANLGSINMPNAWGVSEGSKSVTVAVLDTGYRPHQDFGFNYSGAGSSNPVILSSGYTFISDIPTANNGVGREADALDPGDWITGAENINRSGPFYGCGALDIYGNPVNQLEPSSWHGTHVAGILAAQINNGIGIAGVAPNIRILPVRVLGKCGGYDSDIIDGMLWAAGFTVPGVPNNTHPAQVLSMSLGGFGGTACSSTSYQSAVNEIISAGKVIVVAAGNDGSSTLSPPANCSGVIAVTANSIDGDNAWYATVGAGVAISAPGGDCGGMNAYCNTTNYPGVLSSLNSGTTTPVADNYVEYSGTSMATPHVAAVAALMFSVKPSLTPAQILSSLQSSARPFPPNTMCTTTVTNGGAEGLCGAGLLDAYRALMTMSLVSGWNLVGNSVNAPLTIASAFPIAPTTTNVLSVWKWEPSGTTTGINYPTWAFYTPTLTDGGAGYASTRGYDFLDTINGGEGFWINATSDFVVSLPSGIAMLAANFKDASSPPNPLPSGWSLIAVGDNPTPKTFANSIAFAPPTDGTVATSFTSLWAWDSANRNWYFYAPSLDNVGTLAGYISSKNYEGFTANGKTLDPATGFWINHP